MMKYRVSVGSEKGVRYVAFGSRLGHDFSLPKNCPSAKKLQEDRVGFFAFADDGDTFAKETAIKIMCDLWAYYDCTIVITLIPVENG